MEGLKEAYAIIDDYNEQEHLRGTIDCNLLVLKIHAPDMYEKLYGRYSTIIGGVRVSRKLFGYPKLRDWLVATEGWERIDPKFQRPLDVVVFNDRHDAFISLGNKWFGVNEYERFSIVQKKPYDDHDFEVYRKVG